MGTLAKRMALAAASLFFAASACGATTVGDTSVDDVTLAGQNADAFAFADGWNPHAGPNGDTSGFGTAFDGFGSGSWGLLDKLDLNAGFSNNGTLTFTFSQSSGTTGTWSVTNSSATHHSMLDLVFAMHAGSGAVAFLFDDQTILAGQTLNGTWRIEWFTGNNQAHPDFSNLTLFGRDVVQTPVPEPAEYGMLLAGLGVLGVAVKRRRGAAVRGHSCPLVWYFR